ncbi:MAG: helix-turn-helix domain-containing protein [Candidatus Bathyarchaeota archaeon]|nr:MAG: helix-turn-helix domain-containing protein [Candidatus Bathyarchaeota archaeon]
MKKKLLLAKTKREYRVKDIAIFDQRERLGAALNKLSWKILEALNEKEMYPMELARQLKMHEQKIYYHIRKLVRAGLIRVVREEEKKGAIAKYYKVSFPAFGVELPQGYRVIHTMPTSDADEKVKRFFNPIMIDGDPFNGKVVVGSPDPHGPFKARARDGHYATYLTLFLGRLGGSQEGFAVKLDVDIKAEKEEGSNMILVGGPGTNLITQEVNDFLPIRFDMMASKHGFLLGGLISQETGNVYSGDTVGVIAKLVNPWNEKRRIVVLAGNKAVGTKACVIALTRFSKDTLKNYINQDSFATLIQGFDLDGDGKVDSVEVLE